MPGFAPPQCSCVHYVWSYFTAWSCIRFLLFS